MEKQNQILISVLNHLLECNKDGQQVYHTAGQTLQNPKLKPFLTKLEKQHSDTAKELAQQIASLGGKENDPIMQTQTKPWTMVQTALQSRDENKIMEQCDAAESAIEQRYDETIRTVNIPNNLKELIQRQYNTQRDVHSQVQNLRKTPVTH